ncbi:hypothetical protein [Alicyclobacillus acidiphilus]|uniref:hypothetical protein n=1 Tax=Alicyclobacillus acidiphilus TaxID=182455 RepID=UPI00082E0CB4|nr:hypothetical protein [Alicyclobacillus acidiphilus]
MSYEASDDAIRQVSVREKAIALTFDDGPSQTFTAVDHGYAMVLWSVDSKDWANPGTATIVRNVVSNVHPGDIVLFHDQGGDRTQTVEALHQVLDRLSRKGYAFVTVNDLLDIASTDERGQHYPPRIPSGVS